MLIYVVEVTINLILLSYYVALKLSIISRVALLQMHAKL